MRPAHYDTRPKAAAVAFVMAYQLVHGMAPTVAELAAFLGRSYDGTSRIARRAGVVTRRKLYQYQGPDHPQARTTRNAMLRLDREAGATYAELAQKYGIRRQRAEQVYQRERRRQPVVPTSELRF